MACRKLAGRQLAWFKSNANFQWVNMAPGAQNLPIDVVGEAVAQWFLDDKPLPEELDGSSLQTLVCVGYIPVTFLCLVICSCYKQCQIR